MARTFAEETVETSNTTGTGPYTLEGAKGDYLPFEATYVAGDKPAFVVRNKNNTKWEMNRGGAGFTPGSPSTLARNVWKSTNSNAAVPWTVDDLPLTVYVPSSAEVHEGVVTGWLAAARHALLRAGAFFWTYADAAVRWDRYLALGDAVQTHVGHVDVPSGLYFADGRRPWTAVGAGNKTVAAADIGTIFTFNNSAAARTLTLPAHGDAGIGHGFKVGGLGLTSGGAYGIVVTPAAGDGIEGGADGAARTIPGGVRFDVVWDQASDTWRVEYLNAPIAGPRQTIEGLTYANGSDATNDIDIAAGGCWDSTGAYWMQMAAITKQLDATWAVGTNQGGRLSGSLADGDFNIWAIGRPDTGVIDVGLETTANAAPTLPTNYTYYRKIGWFRRASGAIVAFHTYEIEGGGIEFAWDNLATDVTATVGTSRSLVSLDRVPAGIQVQANIALENNTQNAVNVCCPNQADVAPVFGGGIGIAGVGVSLSAGSQSVLSVTAKRQVRVRTNTSKEVAMRASGAGVQVYASVISFEWPRRGGS